MAARKGGWKPRTGGLLLLQKTAEEVSNLVWFLGM